MLINLDRRQQGVHAGLPLPLGAAASQYSVSKNTIESGLIALALRFEPSQHIGIDANGGRLFDWAIERIAYCFRPKLRF